MPADIVHPLQIAEIDTTIIEEIQSKIREGNNTMGDQTIIIGRNIHGRLRRVHGRTSIEIEVEDKSGIRSIIDHLIGKRKLLGGPGNIRLANNPRHRRRSSLWGLRRGLKGSRDNRGVIRMVRSTINKRVAATKIKRSIIENMTIYTNTKIRINPQRI